MDSQRLLDVGFLIGLTESHRRYRDEYGALTRPKPPPSDVGETWSVVPACARGRRGGAAASCLALIALDVEMIERRRDGRRFPIRVGIVARVFGNEHCGSSNAEGKSDGSDDGGGEGGTRVELFNGFVNPGEHLEWWREDAAAEYDFKTAVHGIERAQLINMRRDGELVPLRRVQALVRAVCCDGGFRSDGEALGKLASALGGARAVTCLVGHKLSADLAALSICGPGLRRRVVDTAMAIEERTAIDKGGRRRSCGASKRAPSLRALVGQYLGAERAATFQSGAHAPLADAEATLDVLVSAIGSIS